MTRSVARLHKNEGSQWHVQKLCERMSPSLLDYAPFLADALPDMVCIVINCVIYINNQVDMMKHHDTSPSPCVGSGAYISSRQPMEQVVDTVVNIDVDTAIPQLHLEANEAPTQSPSGNYLNYAYVLY